MCIICKTGKYNCVAALNSLHFITVEHIEWHMRVLETSPETQTLFFALLDTNMYIRHTREL